jgi:hypothetical protein
MHSSLEIPKVGLSKNKTILHTIVDMLSNLKSTLGANMASVEVILSNSELFSWKGPHLLSRYESIQITKNGKGN